MRFLLLVAMHLCVLLQARTYKDVLADIGKGGPPVPAIEAALRKQGSLPAGQSLADTLRDDEKRVAEMSLAHAILAEPLFQAIAFKGKEFHFAGRRYQVSQTAAKAMYVSAFGDGTQSPLEMKITDLESKKELQYTGIDPVLITRFGFYAASVKPDKIRELFLPAATAKDIKRLRAEKPKQAKVPMPPDGEFAVGGVNSPGTIRAMKQLNGKTLDALEAGMRGGLLGANESLREVLLQDNDLVLLKKHFIHQMLSEPMETLVAQAGNKKKAQLTYAKTPYTVAVEKKPEALSCPLEAGLASSTEVTITNRTNKKSIRFSGLMPRLIRDYGFYGGKESPHRLSPESISAVFPMVRAPGDVAPDDTKRDTASKH